MGPRAWAAAVFVCSLSVAFPARAFDAKAEAVAKTALKKAANDFSNGDYATALARLDRAAKACGVKRCSPPTKALLLRDLGAMQVRAGDSSAAASSFAQALKIQSTLDLPAEYEAPDVRAVWDVARGVPPASKPAPAPEQPNGDFTHTPASEQRPRTPLPVYVEYPGSPPPARVVVKYKGATMSDWGHLDLTRSNRGWEGLIPCTDVTPGTMRYWIQGVDRADDPVANSGDPKHPYSVPIRAEIGEPPHLPGKPAPSECSSGDQSDASAAIALGAAASGADANAGGGGGAANAEGVTSGDGAARAGEEDASRKEAPRDGPARHAHLWVGASLALDFLSMPSGNDVCALSSAAKPLNAPGLYCTNPDGTDFPSRNSSQQNSELVPGHEGQSPGGLQGGDVRVMLNVDYAVLPNVLVGGRMGYVANAYSGSAAAKDGHAAGFKIHGEGRVTYVFGQDPLTVIGFVPMVFGGGGLAEFDGHSLTVVALRNVAGQLPVNAWRTDGPFFVTIGGGARYQFSPSIAFTAALRANLAFGYGALVTFGPEVGVEYGL